MARTFSRPSGVRRHCGEDLDEDGREDKFINRGPKPQAVPNWVSPQLGQQTTNVFSTDGTVDTVGVQLSVPIFSGGLTQSRVRVSQYRWIAAKERLARVSRETERLTRDAYLGNSNNSKKGPLFSVSSACSPSPIESAR